VVVNPVVVNPVVNPVGVNPVWVNPVGVNPVVVNPVVVNPVVVNPVVVATAAPIVQAVAARLAILRELAQALGNLWRPQTIITPRACQVTE
jgi:hypothetical protein